MAFPHDLENVLNIAIAAATPTHTTKSWTIDKFIGHIEKVIPASIHFCIFLGKTTFILKFIIKSLQLIIIHYQLYTIY